MAVGSGGSSKVSVAATAALSQAPKGTATTIIWLQTTALLATHPVTRTPLAQPGGAPSARPIATAPGTVQQQILLTSSPLQQQSAAVHLGDRRPLDDSDPAARQLLHYCQVQY